MGVSRIQVSRETSPAPLSTPQLPVSCLRALLGGSAARAALPAWRPSGSYWYATFRDSLGPTSRDDCNLTERFVSRQRAFAEMREFLPSGIQQPSKGARRPTNGVSRRARTTVNPQAPAARRC